MHLKESRHGWNNPSSNIEKVITKPVSKASPSS
jgi:hypothetical protein